MDRQRVLVFGDDSRAFLAVVRSLGRHGLEVHACPFDFSSPALASRHIAAIHRLPPYNLDAWAWVRAVRALIEHHRFALVVPCDDRSILPLHRHAEAWGGTRVALPNERAFDAFFDKLATRRLAERVGVGVAAGGTLGAESDTERLIGRYGLPLALKPRHSFDLDLIASRRSVRIVETEAELRSALAALDRPEDHLAEAFFDGHGVGVSVLAARGKVVQAFQHRRVQESGPTGGSTYRVSAPLDPKLLAAVEALAAGSALHGVAMFEFRENTARSEAVLLEVNARFWGSLPLAVASGIDFPAQLHDLVVHGRTPPRVGYRVGQYARSLPNDAYRLVRELGDPALPLPTRFWRVAREVGIGLVRTALGRERHDSFAFDDLRPWLAEWRQIGAWLGGGVGRRISPLRRARAALRRRRFRGRLAPQPGRRRRIVAVCFGNICRSPFAAALLDRKLKDLRPDIEVSSAGFVAKEHRPSPDTAVAQAALFGVDLNAHKSRFVRDKELEEADAILVFDASNLGELEQRGVAVDGRVFMLGDFGAQPGDIDDPYGRPAEVFRATYERIALCIDAATARLRS